MPAAAAIPQPCRAGGDPRNPSSSVASSLAFCPFPGSFLPFSPAIFGPSPYPFSSPSFAHFALALTASPPSCFSAGRGQGGSGGDRPRAPHPPLPAPAAGDNHHLLPSDSSGGFGLKKTRSLSSTGRPVFQVLVKWPSLSTVLGSGRNVSS